MAKGQAFLDELREFLEFLRSLWGLLAGISLFFPLSNVVIGVIPIEDGGNPFQNLSPAVVVTLSTLTCIFLTFATFGRRNQFAILRGGGATRHRRGSRSSRRSCFSRSISSPRTASTSN
jgi:hypothetical protein